VAKGTQSPGNPVNNEPIFIIGNGNGTFPVRSNAFEVSYNGHSTVYHMNGPGTVAPAIVGSTYTDNIIYAWGDVASNGAPNCDFGVKNITRMGPGWYRVTISLAGPNPGLAGLGCASITATINTNTVPGGAAQTRCKYIATTRIDGFSQFDVFISEQRFNPATMRLDCFNVDDAFMFKVTGRAVFTASAGGTNGGGTTSEIR
jgi:hypothetical protein